MKKKKLFSLVLATVLTAATVLPCYGASTKEKISNAQAEQAAAQSQLDSIQSRIDELNSKKGQSEEYLSELNQQLDDLQNRLQELQDQYDAKQNELVQIQADLEDAKAKEEEQYEAMKLRIQYMYENSSGNGYMAMLFSSKSISELISRAEYIQKISDFDRDLMQEYEDTVNQVKEKETQVQEEQAAIVELQQQSSDQQEAIQELYAAAYQELRTYSAELDDAKSSESALVDEINSKADAINDLIRQAKEEEIAAQKKAEEEAAAAAAAQQAAAEAEAEAARKQAAEAARVAAAEAANAAAKADTDTSSSSGSSYYDDDGYVSGDANPTRILIMALIVVVAIVYSMRTKMKNNSTSKKATAQRAERAESRADGAESPARQIDEADGLFDRFMIDRSLDIHFIAMRTALFGDRALGLGTTQHGFPSTALRERVCGQQVNKGAPRRG